MPLGLHGELLQYRLYCAYPVFPESAYYFCPAQPSFIVLVVLPMGMT